MTRVICISGPTASGKTQWACALADRLQGAIISVDSAMIYRGMDIGTAKPSAEELLRYPHRLIDVCDPRESYSAARFCDDTHREMADVITQGKVPILVGGTMMYFHALLQGLSDIPASNEVIRKALTQRADTEGLDVLYHELQRIDPTAANQMKPQDHQRILRALEVYELSGRPLSSYWGQKKTESSASSFFHVALMPKDRACLHERIRVRFMQMMERGFLEEVQRLYARGDLHADLPSMRTVGYRQLWAYCSGENPDLNDAIEKGIAATRQLAKRQMTWVRNWPGLVQLDPDDPEIVERIKKG
jgi:tRNA dimethylallyltransferase